MTTISVPSEVLDKPISVRAKLAYIYLLRQGAGVTYRTVNLEDLGDYIGVTGGTALRILHELSNAGLIAHANHQHIVRVDK